MKSIPNELLVLFIGGSKDGHWDSINSERDRVLHVTMPHTEATQESNFDPSQRVTIHMESYTRRRFRVGGNAFSFFALEGIRDSEAFSLLLHHYQPRPRINQHGISGSDTREVRNMVGDIVARADYGRGSDFRQEYMGGWDIAPDPPKPPTEYEAWQAEIFGV